MSDGDEFVGPFASWTNVKSAYGAVGDGVTDDTVALQTAINNVGVSGHSPVIYLPAGTYRITSTLKIGTRQGISIIGQDPSLVTIKWAGPSYQEMFYLNGLSYSKISRITWDGSGTALAALDYGWDGVGSYGGSTYDEDSDEVFKNLSYGIRGGSLGYEDSEHAILRCVFSNNAKAGISVENYNALDYYVWDSTFTNNYLGLTNTNGGGNFHIYGSLFRSSTLADIQIGPTSFFSIRQNFSQGSNAFLIAQVTGSASAEITLQSNVILDTISAPLQINNPGPVVLFDNIIRGSSSQSSALVTVVDASDSPTVPGSLIAIGNTVSQSSWYSVPNGGEVIDINNTISSRAAINPQTPTLPGALPNYGRPIFDVTGLTAAAIQQQIDAAVALNGQRPVVHLPAQNYYLENTVVLPVGSDVQLIGDGGGAVAGTVLSWAGSSAGPVIRMAGPSRAAVRDFNVAGVPGLVGILVQNADQANGRVFLEQLLAENTTQDGLFVNGLDNAQVILHNGYLTSDNVGLQVTGGPKAATGQSVTAKTDMFAGLTAGNNLSYNLNTHGRLMAQDVWYEGAPTQLVNLTDSGVFTLHSAFIAAQDAGHGGSQSNTPSFEVNNFNGSVTLIGARLNVRNYIGIYGNGANTSVLALGILGPPDIGNFFSNSASGGQIAMVDSRQATASSGSVAVADQLSGVSTESTFLLNMLAQTRTEQAQNFQTLPAGVTDARFYRVSVNSGLNGVEIDAGGPSSTTAPNISGVTSAMNSATIATISWNTDQAADSQVFYGPNTAYGSLSALNISAVTAHQIVLNNLVSGTTYHFIVKSRSLSGYISSSSDAVFTAPLTTGGSGSSSFITSFNPGAARNNYSGWIGLQFSVGATAPLITSLGRMMVAGNSGTHTVKIVRASDGGDVSGATATVSMAGGTAGQFRYGALAAPVTLAAYTSYYVVSSEVSGADQWCDVGSVTGNSIGTVTGAVYLNPYSGYVIGMNGSVAFVPVDFVYSVAGTTTTTTPPSVSITSPSAGATLTGNANFAANATAGSAALSNVQLKLDGGNLGAAIYAAPYSMTWNTATVANGTHTLSAVATDTLGNAATAAAITITVSNGSSGGGTTTATGALLTGFSAGTIRNNFTGYAGMQFAVGSSALTVTSVGRAYYSGNSGTHTVKIVRASDGGDVAGGTASVSMAGGTVGAFSYATLASPVSLAANTSYYLVSQETIGGDTWSDIAPVSVASGIATVSGAVYSITSGNYVAVAGTANYSYIPTSLLYSTGSTTTTPTTGTQSFVTSASSGTLRNNFSGWVGYQLTVASTAIQVQSLGRIYVSGNSGSHTVKLVQASTGQDVAGGSVSVAGGSAGSFTYTALASPITLAANTAYYLVSQETNGGINGTTTNRLPLPMWRR